MAFCHINGKRIFYESTGEGPPIVLIHGAGQDTTSWRYNIPYFENSHRVVAVDLPGHGKSEAGLAPRGSTGDDARGGQLDLVGEVPRVLRWGKGDASPFLTE